MCPFLKKSLPTGSQPSGPHHAPLALIQVYLKMVALASLLALSPKLLGCQPDLCPGA